jgi:pectate disaccharide-lyase
MFERTYTLDKGYNTFYVMFTPAAGLTGEAAEFEKMIVYRSYGKDNGEIYVSQNGVESCEGTLKDPVDINSAIKFLRPGQTIILTGGKY